MKKTFTINISGQIFHINEDAYEKLNIYLNTIGRSFDSSGSREEIMGDIEARIAEMFKAKISDHNQVITMADVDEMMAVLGKPEDFMEGEATVPPLSEQRPTNRRLYRDTEERILGGVCSGISAYLGIEDPIWARLLFVLMFFAFGTGPILYIILWIVMPPAKTAAEKLEMRGEPVNISSISKTVSEEAEAVKKKFNEFAEESKKIDTKGISEKVRDVLDKIIKLILELIHLLITVFGKILGFALLLIAGILMAILLGAIIGHNVILFNDDQLITSFNSLSMFFFSTERQVLFAQIGLALLIGIPILGLFISGIKLLLGIRKSYRGTGSVLTVFWLAGLVTCSYVAYELSREFSTKSFSTTTIVPEQPKNTLVVGLTENINNSIQIGSKRKNLKLQIDENHLMIAYPKIDIEPSNSDNFEMEIKNRSFGSEYKESVNRSKRIVYSYSQKDSLILLDAFYKIGLEDKFRGQKVSVAIKVPVGKSIILEPSMRNALYDVENLHDMPDREMAGRKWAMTAYGLQCEDCEGETNLKNKKYGSW